MKMRFYSVWTLAALAGLVAGGCTTHEPVYVAPPPVEGAYAAPPPGTAPAQVPPPGNIQEPPPGTVVAATVPPPAPPAEVPPPAPGPDYVYTPGYYNWNGFAWVWAPGVWIVPPYRGALWLHGSWVFRGGRHVWVGGRWR